MRKIILLISLVTILIGPRALAWSGANGSAGMADLLKSHARHLNIKPGDLRALIARQVVTRPMSTRTTKEMAGFGAVLAKAPPDSFVESYRTLDFLKNNPNISASGRFGQVPALTDLDGLSVDDKDLYALSRCKVGDSDLKLSEAEIKRFQAVTGSAAGLTPQLKARLAIEYKKMLLERIKAYLATGEASLGIYRDKEDPIDAHGAVAGLSKEQSELLGDCGHLYSYLEQFPRGEAGEGESYIYWAKQKFGDLKPVINLVHVLIHKEGDRVYIVSKQIYSSHYTEAALSTAELIPFDDLDGDPHTLVAYAIRLQVDMLGGSLGFIKKRMAQPRLLSTLKGSLDGLRLDLEAAAGK